MVAGRVNIVGMRGKKPRERVALILNGVRGSLDRELCADQIDRRPVESMIGLMAKPCLAFYS